MINDNLKYEELIMLWIWDKTKKIKKGMGAYL